MKNFISIAPLTILKMCSSSFLFIVLINLLPICAIGQTLKFETESPLIVKEGRTDKKISIHFSLENATQNNTITFKVNEGKTSASKDKDFSLPSTNTVALNSANDYKGELELTIKSDVFAEAREQLVLTFSFTDESGKVKEAEFTVYFFDSNDGSADAPQLTSSETVTNKHVSLDVFTGGTLDFVNNLKFQNIGFEVVFNANDLGGPENRFGGFLGISNFENFSRDSSNLNTRTQFVKLDTGIYVPGKSRYVVSSYVNHLNLHTNQWSYYVNPTFRVNDVRSDFFNVYISLRLENLVVSTTRSYTTDTLFRDTTNVPLKDPVFQSGKGFLLQNVTDKQSSGYYSIGVPIFLNAKDKFKVYFDPNFGIANYNFAYYRPSEDKKRMEKVITSQRKAFYLFRLRITEQYSGLNVTIGGDIRGFVRDYEATTTAYLGIRADIASLFSKNKSN